MPTYTVRDSVNNDATSWNNGRKLVRASDGTLWCAYEFPGVNQEIRVSYSTDNGVTWTEEEVLDAWNYYSPALAIDSLGRLHLVFRNQDQKRVEYCVRDGTWSAAEIVDATDGLGPDDPCIAVDSSDNVHIAYIARHPVHLRYNIRYRQKDAVTGWLAAEWVTGVADLQYYVSIAIDSLDNAHLVWHGQGWGVNTANYNIQWRMRTAAGVWQAQEGVTDLAVDQMRPSVAIDSSDDVHVAWFHSAVGGGMRYDSRVAGVWQGMETPDTKGYDPTISLDGDGDIFITYYETVGVDDIWTVEKTGGAWQAPVNITSAAFDNAYPILIWANHPTISGLKTNIPADGCALVFTADVPASPEVRYYTNATWPEAAGARGSGSLQGAILLLS